MEQTKNTQLNKSSQQIRKLGNILIFLLDFENTYNMQYIGILQIDTYYIF